MCLLGKKTAFYMIACCFFSFNSQAVTTCSEMLHSFSLSSQSLGVSAFSERLIQTRFEGLKISDVETMGLVDLRMGTAHYLRDFSGVEKVSVVVIEELVFDETNSLKEFLEGLYSEVKSPGLVVVERLSKRLEKAFSITLQKVEGSVAKSISSYSKAIDSETEEIVIDILNLKELYPIAAPSVPVKKAKARKSVPIRTEETSAKKSDSTKLEEGVLGVKEIEWATLRAVAASDLRVLEFLVKYVGDTVLENQKIIIRNVTKSNADRIAEVINASFKRGVDAAAGSSVTVEIVDLEVGDNNAARSDFDVPINNSGIRRVQFSVEVTKHVN